MNVRAERGYYFSSFTQGGAQGPLAEPLVTRAHVLGDLAQELGFYGTSTSLLLEYGKPVIGKFYPAPRVDPIERVYEILRYNDKDMAGVIFIHPYKQAKGTWEGSGTYKPVLATEALSSLFDEIWPSFSAASKAWHKQFNSIYYEALKKAGLTLEEPKSPGKDAGRRAWVKYEVEWEAHLSKLMPDALRSPHPYDQPIKGIDRILKSVDGKAKKRKH